MQLTSFLHTKIFTKTSTSSSWGPTSCNKPVLMWAWSCRSSISCLSSTSSKLTLIPSIYVLTTKMSTSCTFWWKKLNKFCKTLLTKTFSKMSLRRSLFKFQMPSQRSAELENTEKRSRAISSTRASSSTSLTQATWSQLTGNLENSFTSTNPKDSERTKMLFSLTSTKFK